MGISILLFVSLTALLIFSKQYFLGHIISFIKEIRGTSEYVGEDKSIEFFTILGNIILPIVLLISCILTFFILRYWNKRQSK